MTELDVKYSLDALLRSAGVGSVDRSVTVSLRGLRTTSKRVVTHGSKDNHGYVFVTRPQLNLSTPNILGNRGFYPLLNTDPYSVSAWIRSVLDPRWGLVGDAVTSGATGTGKLDFDPYYNSVTGVKNGYVTNAKSLVADPRSAFINVISNNIVTLTGFPDIQMPTFTSQEGRVGQVWQQIDGHHNLNQPVELSFTIRDMTSSPIFHLLRVLSLYPGATYQGIMSPYADFISEDTIDYNVRVFRILLASDNRRVSSIASTYPGFVQGVTAGPRYDYDLQKPYEDTMDTNYRMTFPGVEYEDPALVDDFNGLVMDANPNMRKDKASMTKLSVNQYGDFTYEALYPFINYQTLEFEWWCPTIQYEYVLARLTATRPAATPTSVKPRIITV